MLTTTGKSQSGAARLPAWLQILQAAALGLTAKWFMPSHAHAVCSTQHDGVNEFFCVAPFGQCLKGGPIARCSFDDGHNWPFYYDTVRRRAAEALVTISVSCYTVFCGD